MFNGWIFFIDGCLVKVIFMIGRMLMDVAVWWMDVDGRCVDRFFGDEFLVD
jgi:hypothetical protein